MHEMLKAYAVMSSQPKDGIACHRKMDGDYDLDRGWGSAIEVVCGLIQESTSDLAGASVALTTFLP